MRFETAPGEQAQVDWGSLAYIGGDGKKRRIWVFVMTLGWPRACYVELVRRADTTAMTKRATQKCAKPKDMERFSRPIGGSKGVPVTDTGKRPSSNESGNWTWGMGNGEWGMGNACLKMPLRKRGSTPGP